MSVGRWNYTTRTYDPYGFHDSWNTPLHCQDHEEIVNCADCGDELRYGHTYTSLRIHNEVGLGFGVCEGCYRREWNAREKAKAVDRG